MQPIIEEKTEIFLPAYQTQNFLHFAFAAQIKAMQFLLVKEFTLKWILEKEKEKKNK